ncbi:MAG: hypothetical protein KGI19_11280, partial [Thaumarchaeota archaeon]|nr:hypothetical protein [Nitrososphaerota archaeon]
MIFTFNQNNQVRWTFAEGFSPPVKTSVIALGFLIILTVWHFTTELIEIPVKNYLTSLDYLLIPASISIISFSVFFFLKVNLGRIWKNP